MPLLREVGVGRARNQASEGRTRESAAGDSDNLDTAQINVALIEIRRLWLFAPDDVIKAANEFITASQLGQSKRSSLTKLVLAMRRDLSFKGRPYYRVFFRYNLDEKDVGEIIAARRRTET